jgi:drug/metabolite transporter (DMT)-like permease
LLHTLKVHAALFAVALLFSINYVIAKWIMPVYLMPFGIIVLRVWGSALLFSILHAIYIREKIQNWRDYRLLFIASLFGIVANQLFFFKGLSLTTPINTAILMTIIPIAILVVSLAFGKEKLTWHKAIGIFLGALGALGLVGGTKFSMADAGNLGNLFLVFNSLTYAVYLVLIKPLMQTYHAITVTKWVFLFGCLGVLPFGWGELMVGNWAEMPAWGYWILVYVIIGATFMTYLLNAWGLKYVNASVVGFYVYLQPVLTSIIAIFLRQDELTWEKIALASLIFVGVYLVSKK